MRAAIALPAIKTIDSASLLRALEVYEVDRLDFAEAYLVAMAEATGIGLVLSFDRTVDRVGTVERQEPSDGPRRARLGYAPSKMA